MCSKRLIKRGRWAFYGAQHVWILSISNLSDPNKATGLITVPVGDVNLPRLVPPLTFPEVQRGANPGYSSVDPRPAGESGVANDETLMGNMTSAHL